MRRRLLFVTDSLGLPRCIPERVAGHQVWVNMVARSLEGMLEPYFYTVAGLHSGDLVSSIGIQLGGFDADVVVLQVGIVDCAPRALRESERKAVLRIGGRAGQLIHGFLSRNYRRIVRWRDITYVSETQFEKNMRVFMDHFKGVQLVVVPIAPANRGYQDKNPLIDRNVRKYNGILERVFGSAFAAETFESADPDRLVASDHHHLSLEGHAAVARAVTARTRKVLAGAADGR